MQSGHVDSVEGEYEQQLGSERSVLLQLNAFGSHGCIMIKQYFIVFYQSFNVKNQT